MGSGFGREGAAHIGGAWSSKSAVVVHGNSALTTVIPRLTTSHLIEPSCAAFDSPFPAPCAFHVFSWWPSTELT